ncbi:DUF1801 domain-containing protein [candidate division WWE3 bacterium]|uniref:DUF1801 domain-containing protein n=1 Tax=candidate division WWE3 bacterium TaxID=2053526 RepID=A0A955LW44_UNCKA|nr:DUF1801 domain-containing protein [candidate division WWE3 bacterium]
MAITTVDEYIQQFPKDTQQILDLVRKTIQKEAPQATEVINYQMPTFQMYKKNLVHFAGYDNHIGFYPTPSAIEEFKNDITKYKWAKGSVQFPIDQPMPVKLIKQMVQFRVKEMKQKYAR